MFCSPKTFITTTHSFPHLLVVLFRRTDQCSPISAVPNRSRNQDPCGFVEHTSWDNRYLPPGTFRPFSRTSTTCKPWNLKFGKNYVVWASRTCCGPPTKSSGGAHLREDHRTIQLPGDTNYKKTVSERRPQPEGNHDNRGKTQVRLRDDLARPVDRTRSSRRLPSMV